MNDSGIVKRYRMGVDVGGTFTDVVLVEEPGGRILVAKVPTVPADPSEGCIHGIDKALQANGVDPKAVSFTVHGTTVATNTIIEGKGAKAGLITSLGFRDVLEIAYQTRPSLYDVFYEKPRPLIPRYLCLGVPERIGPEGEVITPLDEAALAAAGRQLVAEGVQAIAVAFLHSYKDPTHERRARAVLEAACPGVPIVLSSDICPEYREYPRTSTTVVSTVLLPKVGPYIGRLEERLAERHIESGLHLMTSSGGIMAATTAKRAPIHLIESGPAAGVIGAAFVGELAGFRNVIALDIGGTTAKGALVNDGRPQIADEFEVGSSAVATVTAQRGQGYPVRTPVISLVEIGAGGGSIAHVDSGGALQVGPQSAGADPGPACYGRGGLNPTLTDANVVLGRVNPDFFLGGEAKLDARLSEAAIKAKVADPLGMDVTEAARAIVEIADAKMTAALQFVTVQQGIDPREFVLVASGGAGPMQVTAIAQALGVRTVLIPPTPGLNSAVGLLATDLKHELVRTYITPTAKARPDDLAGVLGEMESAMRDLLDQDDVPDARATVRREIDMSYVGQAYNLRVPVPERVDDTTASVMADAFHGLHEATYGFCNRAEPTQFVNLRVIAIGTVDRPQLREVGAGPGGADRALKGTRPVYFSSAGRRVGCAIYDRDKLRQGDRFAGPAIVEQMDATTVIQPGNAVTVDRYGNLLVTIEAAGAPA